MKICYPLIHGRRNKLEFGCDKISKNNSSISRFHCHPLMVASYAKFSSKSYFLLPFNSGASERIRVWLRQKIKNTNSSCWHFMQNFLITNPIFFIFATIYIHGWRNLLEFFGPGYKKLFSRSRILLMLAFYAKFSSKSYFFHLLPFQDRRNV